MAFTQQETTALSLACGGGFAGLLQALLRHAARNRGSASDAAEAPERDDEWLAFLFALGAAFDEAQRDGSVCLTLDAVMGALEAVLSPAADALEDAPEAGLTEEALLAKADVAPDWSAKLERALRRSGRLSAILAGRPLPRLRAAAAAGLVRLARLGLLGDHGVFAMPAAPYPLVLDLKAGLPALKSPTAEELEHGAETLAAALERMRVIEGLRLYCAREAFEEMQLALKLAALAKAPARRLKPETLDRIDALASSLGADKPQRDALELAVKRRFAVICGGPGTGKTTTVIQILECLFAENPSLTVALAAPTGKAASRMRQSISAGLAREGAETLFAHVRAAADGDEARIREHTIHKWLTIPTASGRRPGPDSPLSASVLVVDEASMMDIHLAARLFAAVGEDARVIILGDMHQLAAVGPGAVFADISDRDGPLGASVAQLRTSRRFPEGTVIDRLAKAINHEASAGSGELGGLFSQDTPDAAWEDVKAILSGEAPAGDRYAVTWDQGAYEPQSGLSPAATAWLDKMAERFTTALLNYVEALLSRRDASALEAAWQSLWNDGLGRFRALAAQRRGPMSVEAVNNFMADRVRSALAATPFAADETDEFFPGRVVIVRRNDDMLGLFNGDIGIVVPVRGEGGAFARKVRFGDSGIALSPSLLPEHDTAYAMTIHQSQGSEFDDVAVFLPVNPESGLATRELLYTGVTRTKSTVAIFGSEASLRHAVETPTRRAGGLAARLEEAFDTLRQAKAVKR